MDSTVSDILRSPISYADSFGYSVGHILNDLCSSCWFTYLIIYLNDVQQKSKDFAGILMLVGQVADGLATPLVGILIDRINSRYGRRKTWHAIGTLCVALAFGFIFNKCINCEDAPTNVQQVYYGAFIVLFQFGWASTQISHLSLIPVLTVNPKKIVFLNSIRSGLSFVCGITVYVIMWILLHTTNTDLDHLGPADAPAFSYLSISVIVIGLIFSLLFHLLVTETTDEQLKCQIEENKHILKKCATIHRRISDWLKIKKFYIVAIMYMFTRITVNVPQVYLPLYLTESLKMPKQSIAYYPLMMLLFSLIGSFLCRVLDKWIGKKPTYFIGAFAVVVSSFWFQFQTVEKSYTTYGAAILIGIGGSIMLIMSLSMTADLIGIHTETGAFVYGAMSFLDKIANGVTIALIQHFHPNQCSELSCASAAYYRYIMFLVPGGAAICGAVATLAIAGFTYHFNLPATTPSAGYQKMKGTFIRNPANTDCQLCQKQNDRLMEDQWTFLGVE